MGFEQNRRRQISAKGNLLFTMLDIENSSFTNLQQPNQIRDSLQHQLNNHNLLINHLQDQLNKLLRAFNSLQTKTNTTPVPHSPQP